MDFGDAMTFRHIVRISYIIYICDNVRDRAEEVGGGGARRGGGRSSLTPTKSEQE